VGAARVSKVDGRGKGTKIRLEKNTRKGIEQAKWMNKARNARGGEGREGDFVQNTYCNNGYILETDNWFGEKVKIHKKKKKKESKVERWPENEKMEKCACRRGAPNYGKCCTTSSGKGKKQSTLGNTDCLILGPESGKKARHRGEEASNWN